MLNASRTMVLMLLLAAAVGQQIRYVTRAVLPAQDVVDVVTIAQRFEREGVVATLRAERVSPLFPLLVAKTHASAQAMGWIEARDWATPPQWLAAAALVLAVIPIFLTAERLTGREPAVVASLFFIFLPSMARLGADGIGDALHLCLVAWAVWLLVAGRWLIAGLCIAAALLVRAEAAIVPLSMLLLAMVRAELRVPRFFFAAALCVVPYLAVGVTSPTAIAERLRGGAAPTEADPLNSATSLQHDAGHRLDAAAGQSLTFGRKDSARSSRVHGLAATAREFVDELVQAFAYVLLPLIFIGLWSKRKEQWLVVERLLLAAVALQTVILFVVAWRGGYLSTRHFAIPVALTMPYAALGLIACCRRVATANLESGISENGWRVTTAAFVVASLMVTMRPLHDSQRPHRLAAEWLDSPAAAAGYVIDQQGFTGLRSGRPTYRFDAAAEAFNLEMLRYAVVERSDLEADTPRGASLRFVLGNADDAVARFSSGVGVGREVLVFQRRPTLSLAQGRTSDAR